MRSTPFRLRRSWRAILCSLLVASLFALSFSTALAELSFGSPNFQTKWQRADKPVNDGTSKPVRSWLWGPETFLPSTGVTETYKDSPGGSRQVLYFDKARMEINDAAKTDVTNGLLVRELISGKLATGNADYVQRLSADDVPVAGDPNGNDGPTYASFAKIASLNNDNPSTDRTGQPVKDTLDKTGKVGSSDDLGSKAKYVYFDTNLNHNIPDVFWTFMNQRGTIYEGGKLVENQPVLGDNTLAPWLDATGLPLTDAYWGKVRVAGQAQDVLIQTFERRVLTYTPTNPEGFKVEMGNVGRHYFGWRYSPKYDVPVAPPPPPAPPVAKSCAELAEGKNGATAVVKCGPAGFEIYLTADMQVDENVTVTPIDSKGKVLPTGTVKTRASGKAVVFYPSLPTDPTGQWTFKFKGQTSNKESEAYVWLDPAVTSPAIYPYPAKGKLTDTFVFVVVGFAANQELVFDFKTPKAEIYRASSITATAGGAYTFVITPKTAFGDDAVPGKWVMTAVPKKEGKPYASCEVMWE